MAGYRIDQQVLADSARALDQVADALRDGTAGLRGAGRIDLGTGELDAVAVDLVHSSTTALDRSLADVVDTATGVRRCLADYVDAERRIADVLRQADPG